jgi:uncharacterized protein
MDGTENFTLTSEAALREHYARPAPRVVAKEIDHIDAAGRAFIAASPFCVLATGGSHGLDCSPKGDAPGFVRVADDGKSLMIPDRRGNNRIDGLKNLVENPQVGMIFFVPGANETYRVNGRARVSVDPALKSRFAVNGREPSAIIVVAVEQAFQHCPKALVRSDFWRTGAAPRPKDVPTLGGFAAARDPKIDPESFDADYAKRLPDELY